jgi:hypothetical protein
MTDFVPRMAAAVALKVVWGTSEFGSELRIQSPAIGKGAVLAGEGGRVEWRSRLSLSPIWSTFHAVLRLLDQSLCPR